MEDVKELYFRFSTYHSPLVSILVLMEDVKELEVEGDSMISHDGFQSLF